MIRYREIENAEFAKIFRIYISGSSSAGKTYFARQLLESGLFPFNSITYYHPDFHEHAPVDWDKTMEKQVFFQAGIPSLEELLKIEPNSCLVFDDLFSQCCESKDIDYLFRVLSSKRKISVIIMTQRYFAQGKNRLGPSIRNSCNYHVLMQNSDARTNINVANAMQLKPEITRAIEENKSKLYPYIFLDKTNQARVNGLQVYTNIFGKYKEIICGSMKYYLLTESDFKSTFSKTGNNTAQRNEDKRVNKKQSKYAPSETSASETNSEDDSDTSSSNVSQRSAKRSYYQRSIGRAVEKSLRRRKIRS